MNRKIHWPLCAVFLFVACCFSTITAQQTSDLSNSYYLNAVDLFAKGLYADAESQFRKAADICPTNDKVLQSDIASYRALCAISMVQPNTESIVEDLEKEYGNDPRMNDIYFALAKQCYHSGAFEKSLKWFKKTDNRELSYSERLECLFLHAHAYFLINQYDKALPLFIAIKDANNNKYKTTATYYYAHIEYKNKNYATALEAFQSIRNDERFSTLSGYYILQIYVALERYKDVISEGTELLKSATDTRYTEIARLIIEAYYLNKQYDEALNYFNLYKEKASPLNREDAFLEASIYYNLHKYADALTLFNTLIPQRDSISQAATYYTADAYLQIGDKNSALKYFNEARQQNYNLDIKHDAWINYIKLSMEAENNTKPLYEYQAEHPSEDLHRLLATAYAVEKEYDKAMAAMESGLLFSEQDKADIQHITFGQGISRLDSGYYKTAIVSFDHSLLYAKYDPNTAAITNYWKAEAHYHLKEYKKANDLYAEFIRTPGAFKSKKEYQLAHYNIGYCFLKQKKYNDALSWFRKYTIQPNIAQSEPQLSDSYNRIADCYYLTKKYNSAIENYNKAIAMNSAQSDYSMFQKAMAQGLSESKQEKKLETLAALCNKYPQSDYAPAAIFEIGRTYLRNNNLEHAAKVFIVITQNYKNSPYNQRALIELGLIEVNLGNNKSAIEYYKQAVLNNPSSAEAQDALLGLKNAYLETDDIEEYFVFADKIANGIASDEEKEEVRFAIAEKNYLAGDCDATIKSLKYFLHIYPESIYRTQANFYLGDCSYRAKDYETAKTCLEYVAGQAKNTFTEPALLGLAETNKELELYEDAANAYNKLYAETKNKTYLPQIALLRAKAKEQEKLYAEALRLYQILSKDDIKLPEGAEAAYRAITILYMQQKYDDAIKAVFDFSDTKTPQQYWVARSFIILGDIYLEKDNPEQARSTYNSVLDGYHTKDDGIINAVQQRLDAIK